MNVPKEWLLRYCDPGLDVDGLEERLTGSGTKVEAIHQLGPASTDGFVVGLVLSRDQHPDADRLGVCQVDVGGDEPQQIVCGAPNVGAGQYVPVAQIGAVMPGGLKIKKAKLRGVESRGMICSAKELELGIETDGILVLGTTGGDTAEGIDATKLVPGTALTDVVSLGGTVIELEITPNRPDCLGIYEVARELHAATGAPLATAPWASAKLPKAVASSTTAAGHATASAGGLTVTVSESERCERFTTIVYENVTVGPSPSWLASRLVAAGQRPINNVVDITNYVMLETGQPLHAFDLDRVDGASLTVHSAAEPTKVTTLDGEERTVKPGTILIDDASGPTSIAGLIGGARSEVEATTTRVAMEVATWHGPSIHTASWDLAVRTEASARFEKSLPVEQVAVAQQRAMQLMLDLTGATPAAEMIDLGTRSLQAPVIQLPLTLVKRVLGYELPEHRQTELLRALDLGVESDGTGVLTVTIPPRRRNDITRPIDLIEEIARIDGLDKIPTTLPPGRPAGRLTDRQLADRALLDLLVGHGLSEVVGWSFGNTEQLDKLDVPEGDALRSAVKVRNPMSSELGQLRTTLLPSLLEIAQRNVARGHRDLRLTELGTTYHQRDQALALPDEHRTLGVLLTGTRRPATWADPKPGDSSALDVLDLLRSIGELLRIELTVDQSIVPPSLHPGRGAVVRFGERIVGSVGELHPQVAARWDLDDPVAVLELNAGALLDASPGRPQYAPFGNFPPVRQDLAVVVDDSVPAAAVVAAALDGGPALLKDAFIFDVFKGGSLEEGTRSLALRLEFRADDRTLTEEEATAAREKILRTLQHKVGAVARV